MIGYNGETEVTLGDYYETFYHNPGYCDLILCLEYIRFQEPDAMRFGPLLLCSKLAGVSQSSLFVINFKIWRFSFSVTESSLFCCLCLKPVASLCDLRTFNRNFVSSLFQVQSVRSKLRHKNIAEDI